LAKQFWRVKGQILRQIQLDSQQDPRRPSSNS